MPLVLGLGPASRNLSFLAIFRSQTFTYSVAQQFLTSPSFRVINPRNHVVITDQVCVRLPRSAISGLNDEAVLALCIRGFFGGRLFAIERFILSLFGAKILPVRYTGFKSLPTEKTEWDYRKIPATTFMPLGDNLFGTFKLTDSHLKLTQSDPMPSYVDFGFGSDTGQFAGCHRFSLHRVLESNEDSQLNKLDSEEASSEMDLKKEGEVEVRLEHFRCNPIKNVLPGSTVLGWFHYLYARLLFADGIGSILRR